MLRLVSIVALLYSLASVSSPAVTRAQDVPEGAAGGWQGTVGLAIRVTDDRGVGIAGARVSLLRAEGGGGPVAELTDEEGRLEVDGLAAGEWQIDVRREGYMIYTGYLDLAMGEAPRVGFSSRQRTGTFWAELDVGFAPAGASAELFATDSKQAKAARRRYDREQKADEKEREREARRAERGDLARVIETEAPQESAGTPAAAAKEAATPSAAPAEVEGEVATPAPVVEEVVPEPAAVPDTTLPEKAPVEVAAAVVPDPDPAEAPAPETVPSDSATPPIGVPSADSRLLPAGACRECGPGEWSATSPVRTRPRGDASPGCPGRLERRLADVGEQLASLPQANALAGPLWQRDSRDALKAYPRDEVLNLRSRLEALSGPTRSCVLAAVAIPAGSRYIGYRYGVSDDSGAGECRGDEPCSIGEAQWLDEPMVIPGDDGRPTLVWSVFANESPRLSRDAELTVYFVPPAGWHP